jgi:hypothetical protein
MQKVKRLERKVRKLKAIIDYNSARDFQTYRMF